MQWASALTAAALTGFILSFIFWNHLHYSHRSAAYIIGLVVFCGHLALGFGFVMYFFHYPRPVMPVYNATTPVMSESLFTERRHTNFTQAASSLVLSTSNARGDVEISNETSALVLTTTGGCFYSVCPMLLYFVSEQKHYRKDLRILIVSFFARKFPCVGYASASSRHRLLCVSCFKLLIDQTGTHCQRLRVQSQTFGYMSFDENLREILYLVTVSL